MVRKLGGIAAGEIDNKSNTLDMDMVGSGQPSVR